ncbi:helix-turn-helix transcriptional regulator [Rhodococcus wratislaviensis]|uniref:helix-turn-helix transcriptional regulator n=1 Tax=Rhodococcus wratislaviensis TaxID=44752 RepID=UPI0037C98FED
MVPAGKWSGAHVDLEVEWETLTDRERQILDGIVAGRSNPEMAAELFVSVNTIRFHVANVLRKLQVRSRGHGGPSRVTRKL